MAWDMTENIFNRAAVLYSFEQVGGAQVSLDEAKKYSMERFAFGRQIGSFQALKHKMADMYVKIELARSNAYYGAWALSTDSNELPVAAAGARVSASDAFNYAAKRIFRFMEELALPGIMIATCFIVDQNYFL